MPALLSSCSKSLLILFFFTSGDGYILPVYSFGLLSSLCSFKSLPDFACTCISVIDPVPVRRGMTENWKSFLSNFYYKELVPFSHDGETMKVCGWSIHSVIFHETHLVRYAEEVVRVVKKMSMRWNWFLVYIAFVSIEETGNGSCRIFATQGIFSEEVASLITKFSTIHLYFDFFWVEK